LGVKVLSLAAFADIASLAAALISSTAASAFQKGIRSQGEWENS
jgi:hypothetical protein